MHQHVQEVSGYHDHRENPEDSLEDQYAPAHDITLLAGGILRELASSDVVKVNSLHSQGVQKLADGVTVEAVADDGLIEAFRVDGTRAMALAIQWHPEWRVLENPFSTAIFRSFGDACRDYAARRQVQGE